MRGEIQQGDASSSRRRSGCGRLRCCRGRRVGADRSTSTRSSSQRGAAVRAGERARCRCRVPRRTSPTSPTSAASSGPTSSSSRAGPHDGLHDYAFLGTMGGGLRIFDVTDPAQPRPAGAYTDPGWQNDVQVRGNLAVLGFDPLSGSLPARACRRASRPRARTAASISCGSRSITATARFTTSCIDCVSNSPGGGAHNSTLHPSGKWLAMINPRSHGSVDVVDLRSTPSGARITGSSRTGASRTRCAPRRRSRPLAASPTVARERGARTTSRFSRNGSRMYVSAVGNDTVIVNVSNVLSGSVSTIGVVPNDRNGGGVGQRPERHLDLAPVRPERRRGDPRRHRRAGWRVAGDAL